MSYPSVSVSPVNSTSSALGANQTFTGVGETNLYSDVFVTCKTDQDGTLYVDFSVDGGSNYDSTVQYTVYAGIAENHTLVKGGRTCRIRYVNGSAVQSYLRIQTTYGTFRNLTSGLQTQIQQDADAIVTRSITDEIAIATGLFAGYSIINKFGTNSDIDTGSVPEDIWDNGGVYTGFAASAETLSVFSSSASDASAGTGLRTLRITGLDANYDVINETVTLNGTTPVTTVQTFLRAHTAGGLTAGSGGVNAGDITIRQSTTTANVMITMVAGRNQTNSSAYTIPAGYTGYMRSLHCAYRGSSTGTADGYIWTRSFNSVFRARRPYSFGANYRLYDTIYGGLVFTEKSDLVLRVSSVSAVNTSVNGGYDLVLVRN